MQPSPAEYARDMLEGLDFVLKELSRRNMLAVLVLTMLASVLSTLAVVACALECRRRQRNERSRYGRTGGSRSRTLRRPRPLREV